MNKDNLKLVRVYSSTNPLDAHHACNVLQDHGIDARVTGDGLAHTGLTGIASVDVYTFENDVERAAAVLSDLQPHNSPD